MTLRWASNEDVASVVEFFLANCPLNYISHGDVQSGRASSFYSWSVNLADVLTKEFSSSIGIRGAGLALLELEGTLAGIAFVTAKQDFSVLEDFIIKVDSRSKHLGQDLYLWIEKELKADGVSDIFLESRFDNVHAHRFFKRLGFLERSVVMSRRLQNE